MGQWFARFFRTQGHEVHILDPRPPEEGFPTCATLEEGLEGATVGVLASPLEHTAQAISQVASSGYRGTVFDIASLKGPLTESITAARRQGLRYTSIHPMFGAGARTLSDKVICLCDCGHDEATRHVRGFFEETAVTLVPLSLEQHDRIVSYVLGLSHLVSIVFAHVLAGSGMPFEQLSGVGSTTFLSQMRTTQNVAQENPDLYYAIQRHNPNTPDVYAALARGVESITAAVLADDREAFVRTMDEARAWLSEPRRE
jgi:chorismate mutase/prephenate dehydrogenase